jgi:cytochrome b
MPSRSTAASIRVWDLPTRLFHWSLAACIAVACVSAHLDGEAALRLHFRCGYAVLALVGFRLLWGFAGTHYARFGQFVRGPMATLRYAVALPRARPGDAYPGYPGHNPLGALSVLVLLALCAVQSGSGLFANDEIASEGPLAHLVSAQAVQRSGTIHAWGEIAIYVLVALHVAAIAFYRLAKGEDLLRAMITGAKPAAGDTTALPVEDGAHERLRAIVLLGLSVALVGYVVNLT